MKKMKNIMFASIYAGLSILLFSCNKDMLIPAESVKDLSGSWKIVSLVRNNQDDMTSRIDLTKFRLIFNEDNTYSFQDSMAFIVSDPGSYSTDDPQYPFNLTLEPRNSTEQNKLEFGFPIVNGKRQINLSISPGCSKNTYKYVFEKEQ